MKEWIKLLLIVAGFLIAYYTPWDHAVIRQSGLEAFMMLQDYAREHVLTCLIPAFFIAGAIAAFVSQASVLKYFGAKANKILSYSVASQERSSPCAPARYCPSSPASTRGAPGSDRQRPFSIRVLPSTCWPSF
jgi:Na+/H+-dicarboxylate symporter